MQHWQTERYREWKRDLVVTALAQAGLDAPVDAADRRARRGPPPRHVPCPARRSGDVLEVGFAALRAHRLDRDRPLPGAGAVARRRARGGLGDRRSARAAEQAARHPGDGDRDRPRRRRARLGPADRGAHGQPRPRRADASAGAADPPRRTDRAALGADGDHGPRPRRAAARRIPAGDRGGRSGAGRAGAWRIPASAKTIADLFCGVGPFALRLAERSPRQRVRPGRSRDRRAASRRRNAGRAEAGRSAGARPVPPAAGGAGARRASTPWCSTRRARARRRRRAELAKSKVPLVVAVSCNPATFARDAQAFWWTAATGSQRVTPVDQFRYSPHVEIVARLER